MENPDKMEAAVKAFEKLLDDSDFRIAGALMAMKVVEGSQKFTERVSVVVMMTTVLALIDSILAGEQKEPVDKCKEIFRTRILETLDKRIPKEI